MTRVLFFIILSFFSIQCVMASSDSQVDKYVREARYYQKKTSRSSLSDGERISELLLYDRTRMPGIHQKTELKYIFMCEKEKYSWSAIFDGLKSLYPESGVILVRSRRKYRDPFTPRTIAGMAYMYARYDHDSDSVEVWAYTGKTEDIIDPHDGDWGRWSQREKIVGRRNRHGEWINPLTSIWEAE